MKSTLRYSDQRTAYKTVKSYCGKQLGKRSLFLFVTLFLCAAGFLLTACGSPGAQAGTQNTPAEPERSADLPSISVSELDLAEVLSRGLPVVLHFGDDSQDSINTHSALEELQKTVNDKVLIYSVDLVENPGAKDGLPITTIPSQFFFTAEGKPIALQVNISVLLSTFLSVDTEEPVFTLHEGPLSYKELVEILLNAGMFANKP